MRKVKIQKRMRKRRQGRRKKKKKNNFSVVWEAVEKSLDLVGKNSLIWSRYISTHAIYFLFIYLFFSWRRKRRVGNLREPESKTNTGAATEVFKVINM